MLSPDDFQEFAKAGAGKAPKAPSISARNGADPREDVPPANGAEDYGLSADAYGPDGPNLDLDLVSETQPMHAAIAATFPGDRPAPKSRGKKPRVNPQDQVQPEIEIKIVPPLTLDEWRKRDLPEPDFIMGHWLTTTSRVLLTAATGLGKTNFGLALGMRIAAGLDFLHWQARRPCRVLYIDGEMSRRLLKLRVLDEEKRVGTTPEHFFALSHEDLPAFRPLNTPEGQAWLWAFIKKIGGVDLIIFDNIMCLTLGDQKDPEVWQKTLPLALALTRANIGQVWIHHTGHDETRSYGDKSREWQMDTVAHLDAVQRDDTDISFSLSFKKARERTPATRHDFQDVKIALVFDQWEHEATEARRPDKISPQTQKALEALQNALAGEDVTMLPGNRRATEKSHWMDELVRCRMIDPEAKPDSARNLFNRWRRELMAAHRIACEDEWSWLI